MEDFIKRMTAKTGMDEAMAKKVVDFLKEHADELPKLMQSSGIAEKLPGGAGDKLKGLLGG